MRRLAIGLVLLAAWAATTVPTVTAATDYALWRVARLSLPGGGAATSVLSLCNGDLEEFNGGREGVGCGQNAPDALTTQIVGRPPGEMWTVDIYDHGTCSKIAYVVASFPPIRVSSSGRRTQRSVLTVTQFIRIAYRFDEATLSLRLSNGTDSTCRRFGPTNGGA
jgi:hypothetical protein